MPSNAFDQIMSTTGIAPNEVDTARGKRKDDAFEQYGATALEIQTMRLQLGTVTQGLETSLITQKFTAEGETKFESRKSLISNAETIEVNCKKAIDLLQNVLDDRDHPSKDMDEESRKQITAFQLLSPKLEMLVEKMLADHDHLIVEMTARNAALHREVGELSGQVTAYTAGANVGDLKKYLEKYIKSLKQDNQTESLVSANLRTEIANLEGRLNIADRKKDEAEGKEKLLNQHLESLREDHVASKRQWEQQISTMISSVIKSSEDYSTLEGRYRDLEQRNLTMMSSEKHKSLTERVSTMVSSEDYKSLEQKLISIRENPAGDATIAAHIKEATKNMKSVEEYNKVIADNSRLTEQVAEMHAKLEPQFSELRASNNRQSISSQQSPSVHRSQQRFTQPGTPSPQQGYGLSTLFGGDSPQSTGSPSSFGGSLMQHGGFETSPFGTPSPIQQQSSASQYGFATAPPPPSQSRHTPVFNQPSGFGNSQSPPTQSPFGKFRVAPPQSPVAPNVLPTATPYQFLIGGNLSTGPRTSIVHQGIIHKMNSQISSWPVKWNKVSKKFTVEVLMLGNTAITRPMPHQVRMMETNQNGPVVALLPPAKRMHSATPQTVGYYIVVV
ncbi:hypothetical protein SBOR_8705 [Sclerotinia borealis F-4128]|uniref:Uncharacterized protein n=1 Tax=Sclerotinia borealis (strain F-4128) TaxID=1432307 RepID=W9C7R2_SCLBF|nr:hypothetical protein SBOR_8705 [Sclerotinia borealis F-4128]